VLLRALPFRCVPSVATAFGRSMGTDLSLPSPRSGVATRAALTYNSNMSPRAEEILALALQLPEEERRQLADQLQESVESQGGGAVDLDPTLREELIARVRKVEDGTAVLRDGPEVMRELRAKLAR